MGIGSADLCIHISVRLRHTVRSHMEFPVRTVCSARIDPSCEIKSIRSLDRRAVYAVCGTAGFRHLLTVQIIHLHGLPVIFTGKLHVEIGTSVIRHDKPGIPDLSVNIFGKRILFPVLFPLDREFSCKVIFRLRLFICIADACVHIP